MGKKKSKKRITINPWCWYCERDFEDEKILINHQKAKHFKCPHCSKRLNTAQGMVIHVAQVHKENISKVPNALHGRQDPQVDVFGSDGIPEDDRRRYEERLGLITQQQTPTNTPQGQGAVDPMALKQQLEYHRNMQRQFAGPPPVPPPQYMRPPVPQFVRPPPPPPPPQQFVRPPPPVPPPQFIRPPVPPPMLENKNTTGKPTTSLSLSPNVVTHQNVREKKKSKSAQLVYADTRFSVEERRAQLSRYRFHPISI